MFNNLKKTLFTILIDYKNNNHIYQLWAKNEIEAKLHWAQTINLRVFGVRDINKIRNDLINDPLDAKIQLLKEFDFNVVYGIPKNMLEIKKNLLSQQNDPEFIPQELPEFQSVWITKLELGDDIGRVTIVATETNIISLPR